MLVRLVRVVGGAHVVLELPFRRGPGQRVGHVGDVGVFVQHGEGARVDEVGLVARVEVRERRDGAADVGDLEGRVGVDEGGVAVGGFGAGGRGQRDGAVGEVVVEDLDLVFMRVSELQWGVSEVVGTWGDGMAMMKRGVGELTRRISLPPWLARSDV